MQYLVNKKHRNHENFEPSTLNPELPSFLTSQSLPYSGETRLCVFCQLRRNV